MSSLKWVKKATISIDWKLDFFQNYLGFKRTNSTSVNQVLINIAYWFGLILPHIISLCFLNKCYLKSGSCCWFSAQHRHPISLFELKNPSGLSKCQVCNI